MNLLHALTTGFKPKNSLTPRLEKLFDNLQLPLPGEGEFVYDPEIFEKDGDKKPFGFLIPVHRYGIMIKAESTRYPYHKQTRDEHGLINKKFATLTIDDIEFSFSPGRYLGVEKNDLHWLFFTLYNDGLFLHDGKLDHCGYLPMKTADFPDGIPTVLDTRAVVHTSAAFNMAVYHKVYDYHVANFLPDFRKGNKVPRVKAGEAKDLSEQWQYAQDHLIEMLRHRFNQAVSKNGEKVDAGKMKLFWDICYNMASDKEKPLLSSSWKNKDTLPPDRHWKTGIMPQASQLYEKNLAGYLERKGLAR